MPCTRRSATGRIDDIDQDRDDHARIGHSHHFSKTGALNNPADRDHCLQYMAAIGLLKGDLIAEDYEDDVAGRPAR